jgi:hypothetical protein
VLRDSGEGFFQDMDILCRLCGNWTEFSISIPVNVNPDSNHQQNVLFNINSYFILFYFYNLSDITLQQAVSFFLQYLRLRYPFVFFFYCDAQERHSY